jgi:hypothetical protein
MTAVTHVEYVSNIARSGYELVPDKTPPLKPGQHWLHRKVADLQPARIVGKGGKTVKIRLDDYPALFTEFASVETPQELLEFVTKYGPLGSDIVPLLLDQAKQMRKHINAPRGKSAINLSNLMAQIVTDRITGDSFMRIVPPTLLDALWYQLGQAIAEGAAWRECKHCHKPFLVGGNSGKRIVAEFCSHEHKKRFFSLARSRRS